MGKNYYFFVHGKNHIALNCPVMLFNRTKKLCHDADLIWMTSNNNVLENTYKWLTETLYHTGTVGDDEQPPPPDYWCSRAKIKIATTCIFLFLSITAACIWEIYVNWECWLNTRTQEAKPIMLCLINLCCSDSVLLCKHVKPGEMSVWSKVEHKCILFWIKRL